MSVYNKPDIKPRLGNNTPSYIHRKINSVNFGTNSYKSKENDNKYNNINTEENINKLYTPTYRNKKIEIKLNKNYSPRSGLNKTSKENLILLKKRQTSSNNLNNSKNCNIIINNNIESNSNINEKYSKNNNGNINININISKNITYIKSKDKKNIINSANNSELKNKYNINQHQTKNNNNTNTNIIRKEYEHDNNYNKIRKDNKPKHLNQIQLPMNSSVSPRNYLRINQGKNYINKINKSYNNKNNNQRLTDNNNILNHNNTENNILINKDSSYNTYKKKTGKNSPKKGIYMKRKNSFKNLNFDIDADVDCPEELHFFLINIFQKGNKLNFERNKTIK